MTAVCCKYITEPLRLHKDDIRICCASRPTAINKFFISVAGGYYWATKQRRRTWLSDRRRHRALRVVRHAWPEENCLPGATYRVVLIPPGGATWCNVISGAGDAAGNDKTAGSAHDNVPTSRTTYDCRPQSRDPYTGSGNLWQSDWRATGWATMRHHIATFTPELLYGL